MGKVAVIGSGPAGLMCAEKLAGAGFSVKVFDELAEFGGMLAYGIPEFRIPLSTVREKIAEAKKQGVAFEKKKITSVKTLLKENGGEFDFVVIAIGAGNGAKAGFIGENEGGVLDALMFLQKAKLENKKLVSAGEKVAVIGGGNSAMDAARVAKRQGANVTILYRRTENEMPALKSEIDAAKKEGIAFEFLKSPERFIFEKNRKSKLICKELALGEKDASGRRAPIETGKTIEKEFDKIISATGQKLDLSWLEKEGIKTNGRTITVDAEYKTNLNGVYACGDSVNGPKTIASATITGLATANAIIKKAKLV